MEYRRGNLTTAALGLRNIEISYSDSLNKIWERELSKSVAEVLNNILEDGVCIDVERGGAVLSVAIRFDERIEENNPKWSVSLEDFLVDEAEYQENPDAFADLLERAVKRIRSA